MDKKMIYNNYLYKIRLKQLLKLYFKIVSDEYYIIFKCGKDLNKYDYSDYHYVLNLIDLSIEYYYFDYSGSLDLDSFNKTWWCVRKDKYRSRYY